TRVCVHEIAEFDPAVRTFCDVHFLYLSPSSPCDPPERGSTGPETALSCSDIGGGYRREAVQVFELFLHLTVQGGLGVEGEIAKGRFHFTFQGTSTGCVSDRAVRLRGRARQSAAAFDCRQSSPIGGAAGPV